MTGDPKKRSETIHVRLTPEGVARLDSLRGAESRSEYMRRLLRVAVAQDIRGPRLTETDGSFR